MSAINVLIEAVRKQSTEMIVECVKEIGACSMDMPTEQRMVRAALIEVYMERNGEAAADALMDSIELGGDIVV